MIVFYFESKNLQNLVLNAHKHINKSSKGKMQKLDKSPL